MSEFSWRTRQANLARLSEETFDLLIIGGSITGAGIALDAAARGLKTALIEKRDFAAGTSSRSTKLIHGGLRYLEHFDFALGRAGLHRCRHASVEAGGCIDAQLRTRRRAVSDLSLISDGDGLSRRQRTHPVDGRNIRDVARTSRRRAASRQREQLWRQHSRRRHVLRKGGGVADRECHTDCVARPGAGERVLNGLRHRIDRDGEAARRHIVGCVFDRTIDRRGSDRKIRAGSGNANGRGYTRTIVAHRWQCVSNRASRRCIRTH